MPNVLAAAAFTSSLALLAPAAARAQGPARFEVGLRVGYAVAVGSSYADPLTSHAYSLADGFRSQIPFQLEGTYRLTDWIAAGPYVSLGFDSVGRIVKAACDAVPARCSAETVRLGVQGFFWLREIRPGLVPWLGLGLGWEWSSYSQSSELTMTFSGPEVACLQAGADWRAFPNVSLGPYLQASIGRFWGLKQSEPEPRGTTTVDLDVRSHAWLGLGLRGAFHL